MGTTKANPESMPGMQVQEMEQVGTKLCVSCNKEKDAASFRRGRNKCKHCLYKQQKEWVSKNPDKILQYGRKYERNNRDKINAKSRIWASKNREKRKTLSAKWRSKNKDKSRNYQAVWRSKNIEKAREKNREWARKNWKYLYQYKKRRMHESPEYAAKVRIKQRKRNSSAVELATDGYISRRLRLKVDEARSFPALLEAYRAYLYLLRLSRTFKPEITPCKKHQSKP